MNVACSALIVIAAMTVISSSRVAAQTIQVIDDAKLPRFEIASVKAGDPGVRGGASGMSPIGFRQENSPLFGAVMVAFGARPYQLATVPDFIYREPFTIDARTAASTPPAERPLMIRALLIDQFKLRYHVERKQQDGYALTVARSDGTLGPKLRPSRVDCAARLRALAQKQPLDPLPVGAVECGARNSPGVLRVGGASIQVLVQMLSNLLGKPLVDQTGLIGEYDVDLRFAVASAGPLRADGQASPPDVSSSILTALQEQLGLKLRTAKAAVDMLVIDHIERPDPD
jgi:uncharacterized protein (TIGR03435 family)